jgi:hypothetical protein
MAIGTMANYTANILVDIPRGAATWGIQTFRVNGASELYPGHCTTQIGHTHPDCGRPDADTDSFLGIALDNPDADIDTYFADNAEISVALAGSGAVVWVYVDDDEGACVSGTRMYHTGADDDGFVEKYAAAAAAPTTYDDATIETAFDIFEQEAIRFAGVLVETIADQGTTDTPELLALI